EPTRPPGTEQGLIRGPMTPIALPVEIAMISSDPELAQHFKDLVERNFNNAKVHLFQNLQDFIYTVDPELAKKDKKEFAPNYLPKLTAPISAIIGDQLMFENNFKERWQTILETVKTKTKAPTNPSGKTDLFVLAKKSYSDQEERALGVMIHVLLFIHLY